MNLKLRAACLLLSAGSTALDLWSKALWPYPRIGARQAFPQKTVIEDWIYIETTWNTGGVWSIDLGQTLLLVATAIAVPLIAAWIFWPKRATWLENAGKALVLGGAIGNLYDRYMWRAVRDFIAVCFGDAAGWCWPTFNVADMALVVGIGVLLVTSFLEKKAKA